MTIAQSSPCSPAAPHPLSIILKREEGVRCGNSLVAGWILLNTQEAASWDPYPFILLNLLLSCLAAIQAPVIMMSQNRLAAKDRVAAQQDYEVNL